MRKIQESSTLKLVRVLNGKMIEPTNFEKMNVAAAVNLFKEDVTAGLQILKSSGQDGFSDVDTTVEFMEIVKKWWKINDVCNASSGKVGQNRGGYWNLNDERLKWLETDFLKYFDDWKESTKPAPKPKKPKTGERDVMQKTKSTPYLTRDTDLALRLTTLSMVLCTRYLLRIGFQFVLTKIFSSDSVEYFFSSIRQMGGRFDQMNVVSSMFALEKIMKIGIISGSEHSNVGDREEQSTIRTNVTTLLAKNEAEGSPFLDILAKRLEDPPEIEEITIEVAGSTMVAAFLCKLAKDNFSCPRGTDFLISKTKDGELCEFIRRQDIGGLLYPIDQLINLVVSTVKLLDEFWTTIREWRNPGATLESTLFLPFQGSGIVKCGCENRHCSNNLQKLIIKHLVKIFLHNKALNTTQIEDKPMSTNKPSCRKVLKLS